MSSTAPSALAPGESLRDHLLAHEGDELVADGRSLGVLLEFWAWSDMQHGRPTQVWPYHAFAVPWLSPDSWGTIHRPSYSILALLDNGAWWRSPVYSPREQPDWLEDYIGGSDLSGGTTDE
jgi:hypothetical protein